MKVFDSNGKRCSIVPYYVQKQMGEWFVLRCYDDEGVWGQGFQTESSADHVCSELNKAHLETRKT